jgi:aryl-alcohol dehydrogenase-like predicted oxidoreductase
MIPLAPFGRTRHQSSRVIFGAAALGGMSQAAADRTLAIVDAAGVNHIDTAASYGASEDRLHDFLADHRQRYFLATKTGERSGPAARAELERSLQRMGVDHIDLIQLHNLVEDDEWDAAFAGGGAVAALARARDEGLVSYIGVTGHGVRIPGVHLRSLERFDFDSVLFPYNHSLLLDPGYADDVDRLRRVCAERGVAIQTIKSIARRRWADPEAAHFSWYEPITEPAAFERAVRFVLANPDLFLNSTSDASLLPRLFAVAAGQLDLPTDAELEADRARLDVTPLFDGAELERI